MNRHHGKEMPFREFTSPHFHLTDFSSMTQAERDDFIQGLVELEQYQNGSLPIRVRVEDTARAGSILRIEGLSFYRTQESGRYKKPWLKLIRVGAMSMMQVQSHLHIHSGNNHSLMLDDGTDVTDKISYRASLTVLLGSTEPTVVKFTKKAKDAKPETPEFVDQFGETLNVGCAMMASHGRLYIGKLLRYYPAGGMLMRTLDGEEVKIMLPHVDNIVKLDSRLAERVMLAKLGKI